MTGHPDPRRASPFALLALLALLAPAAGCAATPDDDDSATPFARRCNGAAALCDRPFPEVTLPGTHNSMSNAEDGWLLPNQPFGIPRQLEDGVRGFLLDTHYDDGRPSLCHELCAAGRLDLVQGLGYFRDFLAAHPNEVLALIVQDGISPEDTAAAFAAADLTGELYVADGAPWPTLGGLIDARTRIVVGAEFSEPPPAWYHHAWDLWFDTPYSFDSVKAFSCALNRGASDNPLYLVNHWISAPFSTPANAALANTGDVLLDRARECEALWDRPIQLLAVDHYAVGDLFDVVRTLNEE